MTRVGKQQLQLLIMRASPTSLLLTTDKVSDSLVRRGLFVSDGPITTDDGRKINGGCAITPAGLRVLADEMEAGRVKGALARMKADAEARRQKRENR